MITFLLLGIFCLAKSWWNTDFICDGYYSTYEHIGTFKIRPYYWSIIGTILIGIYASNFSCGC